MNPRTSALLHIKICMGALNDKSDENKIPKSLMNKIYFIRIFIL